MNITNQIRLSVLISLILVTVISVSIVITNQNMQDLRQQETLAADLLKGSYELAYLSNEYFITAEPRAYNQWEERYASLHSVVIQLKATNTRETRSIDKILDYYGTIGTLFHEISEPGTVAASTAQSPSGFQQITWTRMNIQSQGLIVEAWTLRHLYDENVNDARFWNNVLVLTLILTILVTISVNYLLISRRFVRSIREIDAGCRTFADGDLDYRISLQGTDELGNIGIMLNSMASNLKTITASRDELDREVDLRRQAEEALKIKNTDLEAANEELIASDEEIRNRNIALAKSTQELEQERDRTQHYLDIAGVMLSVLDRQGRITLINRKGCEILGYSEQELLGSNWFETALPEEARDEVMDVFDKIMAGDISPVEYYENPVLTKTNEKRIIAFHNTLISTSDGITGVLFSGEDVTDQRRAETALRESRTRLRMALDVGNTGVWEWNIKTNEVHLDEGFHRMLGYDPGELPKTLDEWMPYHNQEDVPVWMGKAEAYLRGDTAMYESEHRIRAKDGTWAWVFTRGQFISSATLGPGTLFVGTAMNVTERRQAEDELRASEERFRIVFDQSIAGKSLTGASDGHLLRINKAFADMLGYSVEKLQQMNFADITLPEDLPESRECIRSLVAGEKSSHRMEKRYVHKSGRIVWADVSTSILRDLAGKPLYLMTTILDITERKTADEQREQLIRELEQKIAELERFNYSVSHDLRSPLLTIKWFAGLLENEAGSGDTAGMMEDAHRITDAAGNMEALLADLLEFSRIGRIVKPPEEAGFGVIAREAVELLAGPLAERGIRVEISPDLPVVSVDPTRSREVMVNLIENAIKFSGTRPDPLIRIGVDNTGGTPIFFVQDNGIGIDPRYLNRIFNLFERLDPSSHGTGLGLPIVKRIIEIHGGKIWAESGGLGKGTTFRFTLPGPGIPMNEKDKNDTTEWDAHG